MTDTTQTTEETQDTTTGGGSADQTGSNLTDAGKVGKGSKASETTATTTATEEKPWFESLPDDLKGEKSVMRHASLEDAIRAAVGAEKRLGVPAHQLVRLPTKDEEFADLYRKLGAPETADGYEIGLPDDASDEDKAAVKSFAEHMHKAGPFPPAFLKAAVEWNNAQAEAAAEALTAANAEAKAAGEAFLKKELGADYDPEMKAVGKLLNDLGGKELRDELNLSDPGKNPRLMLALQKVVERLGESGGLDGQGRSSGGEVQLSRSQAKAAALNIENDPVKGQALRDSSHSMHKSVVAERNRLLKIAEGIDPDA